jgi:hypothetical protein
MHSEPCEIPRAARGDDDGEVAAVRHAQEVDALRIGVAGALHLAHQRIEEAKFPL